MFISFVFSVVIFVDVNRELSRFEHFQTTRQQRLKEILGEPTMNMPINNEVDEQLIYEARSRLITSLILLNICILAAAGGAGYFLAGRTLTPIHEALEDQARFIGDASHELKTPITSLRSEIEVYLRSKEHTLEEAEAIIKSNLEEVIRLQSLFNGLMELTSFGRINTKSQFVDLSLSPLMKNAVKNLTPIAHAKNITIVNKANNIKLKGNEQSLTRLFTILLDNAIKYSHENKKIAISSNVRGGVAFIRVADQGIGIAQDEIQHIFSRFYRVDKSRSSFDVPGYGLGLSIAKEIVKLHKGAVNVKSTKKGSVFTVELPV
jgi:signal transduction histidine kinase